MSGRAKDLVRVPFTFEARVLEHRKHGERHRVYGAVMPVKLESIPSAEVAYVIELGPDEAVHILYHRGRLIWPMTYIAPFCRAVAGDALAALEDGTLPLFGEGRLNPNTTTLKHDLSVRKVIATDDDRARARVWRKAESCLLLGGKLYADGGVPIFVARTPELSRRIFVASSGASRHAEPRSAGLWVQPGGFHLKSLQEALARGLFRLPDQTLSPANLYPRIVVCRAVSVDPLDLRVDATFRELLPVVKRELSLSTNGEYAYVVEKFERAIDGDGTDLTAARCDAMHAILATDMLTMDQDRQTRLFDLVATAAASGRTITHEQYLKRMKFELDEALASLARAENRQSQASRTLQDA